MLFAFQVQAQNISLNIISAEEKSEVNKMNYRKKFSSKDEAHKEIENIVRTLQSKGYLLASADTIFSDSLSVSAKISQNQIFKFACLKLGNLNTTLASKLGISEKLYFNKPFKYDEVSKSFEKIIRYYENNGYPFASVRIDSSAINNNELSGVLNVQ